MMVYLLKTQGRNFSPAELERRVVTEIDTKVVGQPLNEKVFKAIAQFVDEMSIYLEQQDANNARQRAEDMAARAGPNERK